MKYRHLFFDLDHTLWDFNENARITLSELHLELELEKAGVSNFEQFLKVYLSHNEQLWEKYRSGMMKAEELRWRRMWNTLSDFGVYDETLARRLGNRFLELLPTRKALFPGTVETLQYLKDKGYQLHLITNGFEETQHCKLRNCGISGFFAEVITSEGSNSMKPKKEIFDYALNKAKALHHQSIMIGDSIEVDIKGAINAGIDQVYVNHIGELCNIRPTYTVTSLKELKEIF
ncbi:MAG: YjjG family noncanonical pyrimidine nucleotidase [Chitinophagaceae bacterium]|nr:YjjG family noncanonical pyrimidine nucleotidase [Chitinophagaceae bacterium]